MLFLLDTDHLSEFDRGLAPGLRLRGRIEASLEAFFISVITMEQVTQGWLARLKHCKSPRDEIHVYARFQSSMIAFSDWDVLPWDEEAVERFESLRSHKLRVGTMDLKIASIALAYDATVLTRNSVDFAKVPGLRIENGLD